MSTLAVNKATDVVGTSFYELMRLETAKSATGTSVEFTSIPSWVKRITFMLNGVSTNSTSPMQIQLGDSGGYETSGYNGSNHVFVGGIASVTLASAFLLTLNTSYQSAAGLYSGSCILTLIDASTNTWSMFGSISGHTSSIGYLTSGSKALSATLDRIRITMANGTDTFDLGSVSVLLEGHNA
jgi:hypothetical protein